MRWLCTLRSMTLWLGCLFGDQKSILVCSRLMMTVFQLTPLCTLCCLSSYGLKRVLWTQHLMSNHRCFHPALLPLRAAQLIRLLLSWSCDSHFSQRLGCCCCTEAENSALFVVKTVWHGEVRQREWQHLYLSMGFIFLRFPWWSS